MGKWKNAFGRWRSTLRYFDKMLSNARNYCVKNCSIQFPFTIVIPTDDLTFTLFDHSLYLIQQLRIIWHTVLIIPLSWHGLVVTHDEIYVRNVNYLITPTWVEDGSRSRARDVTTPRTRAIRIKQIELFMITCTNLSAIKSTIQYFNKNSAKRIAGQIVETRPTSTSSREDIIIIRYVMNHRWNKT